MSPTDDEKASEPAPARTEAGTGPETGTETGITDRAEDAPAGYRLRRAPRYRAFGFTGVFLGVLVGAVLALSYEATSNYSARTILGYFVAICGLLGALIGCGVAVLLDRRKD